MKRTTGLALAIVLTGAVAQEADQVPQRMDVKGFALGTTLNAMRASARLKCRADASGQFDTLCEFADAKNQIFAGQRAVGITFSFFGEVLDSATIVMPGRSYSEMKHAMDLKFGEATPSLNINGLCTYRMNGDRGYVMFLESGPSTVVTFNAAAGAEERARRLDLQRRALKSTM